LTVTTGSGWLHSTIMDTLSLIICLRQLWMCTYIFSSNVALTFPCALHTLAGAFSICDRSRAFASSSWHGNDAMRRNRAVSALWAAFMSLPSAKDQCQSCTLDTIKRMGGSDGLYFKGFRKKEPCELFTRCSPSTAPLPRTATAHRCSAPSPPSLLSHCPPFSLPPCTATFLFCSALRTATARRRTATARRRTASCSAEAVQRCLLCLFTGLVGHELLLLRTKNPPTRTGSQGGAGPTGKRGREQSSSTI
jgi:hypothetical protein